MRQVVIYPGEDGYYVAEVPSLPGCISQGESKEAALATSKRPSRSISPLCGRTTSLLRTII